MACQTKNQCSYDDGSKARLIEQVQSDGPRQCAANQRLLIVCDYESPGVWFADLGDGETITISTDGSPNTSNNWTVTKTGFPENPSDCPDLPVKTEGGVVSNSCTSFKLQTLDTYGDGSTVYKVQQINIILNGNC